MEITENKIIMPRWDNWHAHFRQDKLLPFMIHQFMQQRMGRVIAMPNTRPAILTADQAIQYQKDINTWVEHYHNQDGLPKITPVMTFQITEETTLEMVDACARAGVMAGKIYPTNMTTHSENGVETYMKLYPIAKRMEELHMIMLFHGESPNSQVEGLDKELRFLDTFREFVFACPKLRCVLEHITTEAAVICISTLPDNAVATITAHHLYLTLDDVIGYSAESGYFMQPHNMCKPVAKRREDSKALVTAAISGNPKFFCGNDDAAHYKSKKECANVCAGIFNTPTALALIVQIFEQQHSLDKLEGFLSLHGAQFYQMQPNSETITLKRDPWTVPTEYPVPDTLEVVIPFLAGENLEWQIAA